MALDGPLIASLIRYARVHDHRLFRITCRSSTFPPPPPPAPRPPQSSQVKSSQPKSGQPRPPQLRTSPGSGSHAFRWRRRAQWRTYAPGPASTDEPPCMHVLTTARSRPLPTGMRPALASTDEPGTPRRRCSGPCPWPSPRRVRDPGSPPSSSANSQPLDQPREEALSGAAAALAAAALAAAALVAAAALTTARRALLRSPRRPLRLASLCGCSHRLGARRAARPRCAGCGCLGVRWGNGFSAPRRRRRRRASSPATARTAAGPRVAPGCA